MQRLLYTIIYLFFIHSAINAQGYLGVLVRDYKIDNISGARVVNILDDGAAKNAGIIENDIIYSINNLNISNKDELISFLRKSSWGDEVKVQIYRNGDIEHLKFNLGYKKDTKTYQLHKKQINDTQHWYFEDDNTEIVLDNKDNPISIQKNENNCITDKWYVGEAYKEEELPQCFLDLDDKLFAIKRIKQDQAKRNVKIDYITYIKTLVETDSLKKEVETKELSLETFAIYPNPNNGLFSIKIESADFSPFRINIFDITGKVVIQEYVGTYEGLYNKQYDFRTLSQGTYLIQVIQNEKRIAKKIVIQ
jgi:membrane-associated protease RseP (regulator of RpoE activity)